MLDVLFIAPGNSKKIYQGLADKYSAIEPPTWALLLAESCRSIGYKVGLIDVTAQKINEDEVLEKIIETLPRFICFVVYGQNVNAGTANMSGTVELANYIKKKNINIPICVIGSHVQALPTQTLKKEKSLDIVFTNEGVYALRNLLGQEKIDLTKIKGIAYRNENDIVINSPEHVVPQDRMDIDLPGYAWDLLPYSKTPFDLYRSPLWHGEYKEENRTPYAAISTSLGCRFGCNFCMINILNRNDNDEVGVASNYKGMRYWSPEFIIKEFDKLNSYGVKTIRIVDEMFLLNKKYYVPLCNYLIEREYSKDLRMWAYSRIDTVAQPELLKLVRKAGIKWLAIGIETSSREIRLEIDKGRFENIDITEVIKRLEDADIGVMANYIVGLPGETSETMQKTFDLSIELNSIGWNCYTAMPLPGSLLYKEAIDKGIKMPEEYSGYSFHSYDIEPLPTEKLTSKEILKFRDEAYIKYHTNPKFLEKVRQKYGEIAVQNVLENTKIKLKRRILEND